MGCFRTIIGEDGYLVEQTAKKCILAEDGLEIIDSKNSTNSETRIADLHRVEESLLTPPFFSKTKTTWWCNVDFLPGAKNVSEDVKVALDAFCNRLMSSTLPENQAFILTASQLTSNTNFAKTLAKLGEVTVFAVPKPWDRGKAALQRLREFAKEYGLNFTADASEAFIAKVGTDSRTMINELAKLRTYLGEGQLQVTRQEVEAIISRGIGSEPELWTITDAITSRNVEKTIEGLNALAGESGFAVFISTILEKLFRQFAEIAEAVRMGIEPAQPPGMTPGAYRKCLSSISKWTVIELRRARWRFLELRERAVSVGSDCNEQVFIEALRALYRKSK